RKTDVAEEPGEENARLGQPAGEGRRAAVRLLQTGVQSAQVREGERLEEKAEDGAGHGNRAEDRVEEERNEEPSDQRQPAAARVGTALQKGVQAARVLLGQHEEAEEEPHAEEDPRENKKQISAANQEPRQNGQPKGGKRLGPAPGQRGPDAGARI